MYRAAVYPALAAFARASGYPEVTASAVHDWRKDGLLPRASPQYWGFGRRSFALPVDTGQQILTLCRYRYQHRIRSHLLLAAAVWAEGYGVEEGTARAGLAEAARLLARPLQRRADPLDAAGDLAYALSRPRNLPPGWRARGADTKLVERGMCEVFARAGAGVTDEPDLPALAHLEELSGLARGRTDAPDGTEPWLSAAPGMGMVIGLDGTNSDRLASAAESAAVTDLETARERAVELEGRFNVLLPTVQLVAGEGYAGFDLLAEVLKLPLARVYLTLVVLLEPDGANNLLVGLPSGTALAEIEASLPIAQALLESDPELRERVRSVGMAGALGRLTGGAQ